MGAFQQYRKATMDRVLLDEQGEAWCDGLGAIEDTEHALAKSTAKARFPRLAPVDGLDILGEAYALERYPEEQDATYRSRLAVAFPTWRKAGSPEAIEDQFRAYGIIDVRVWEDHEITLGPGSWYSRFIVTIGPDFGVLSALTPTLEGTAIQGFPTLQGASGVSIAQIQLLKKIILKFKSAHSYPLGIVLLFDSSPFAGAGPIAGSYVNANGDYLIDWPLGKLVPVEAPTTALPYQL